MQLYSEQWLPTINDQASFESTGTHLPHYSITSLEHSISKCKDSP
jgi:hypothetical protein